MPNRRAKTLTVAIATETRAEYGLLRPVYRAIDATPGLRAVFIASGMHHLRRFGHTIDVIRADGVRVREIRTASDPPDAARDVGRAVSRYAGALTDLRADWLIVLGDRLEMLAAATAATALGVAIGHLHGGDVAPGARDDAIRHAITKLAHLHFPATADAARRIARMGEPSWRIVSAGTPAIDVMRQTPQPGKAELDARVGFDTAEPFALVVQHAAGFPAAAERRHLLATLHAVEACVGRAVVIGPGLDPGSVALHEAIARFVGAASRRGRWAYFRSLEQGTYYGLMSRAAVMAGNSSSGIIESAAFRLATVDVGPRQAGRLAGGNVIRCGYGRADVAAAIRRAMGDAAFRRRLAKCRNVYGRGGAGAAVARALVRTPLDRKLLVKTVSY
ncbi:MAG: GDP/UDP-N,N'-diacetylbacillosamine 2-epimerase (hydrolyzing) [Phycisphaerae bacterium]|nr:GDP/UDP-N,N'-diacetylbacillosamine 2-epimerase (hydrolyzing) [Phycisphaerae bacterium]